VGLREIAAADNATILEDLDGFGWPVSVTSPENVTADLVGFTTDVGTKIDPETGMMITGRTAEVSLRIDSCETAFSSVPRGVAESDSRPWVVEFADANGHAHTFKVFEAMVDRALGLVVCRLEKYSRPGDS
jgi:hypothetical protein